MTKCIRTYLEITTNFKKSTMPRTRSLKFSQRQLGLSRMELDLSKINSLGLNLTIKSYTMTAVGLSSARHRRRLSVKKVLGRRLKD